MLNIMLVLLMVSCSRGNKAVQPIDRKQTPVTDHTSKQDTNSSRNTSHVGSPKISSSNKELNVVSLLDGKVSIAIPKSLHRMDRQMFVLKYPLESSESTVAYSDENATVSLLISPRQDVATQADLPKLQKMIEQSFSKSQQVEIKGSRIDRINGRDFILVEMITPAADTRVFNRMFITTSNSHLLMCTFNCTLEKRAAWAPVADEIIRSIRVID